MHVLLMQHNTCKRLRLSGFLYCICILSLSSEGGKMLELRASRRVFLVRAGVIQRPCYMAQGCALQKRIYLGGGSRYVLHGDLHIIISAISPSSDSSRLGLPHSMNHGWIAFPVHLALELFRAASRLPDRDAALFGL